MNNLEQAEIDWFNKSSGEGMVKLNRGGWVYLYFTEIDGVDSNNWAYPKEGEQNLPSKGDKCLVKVYEDTTFTQIEYCKTTKGA